MIQFAGLRRSFVASCLSLIALPYANTSLHAQVIDTTGETDTNNLSTYQASSSYALYQTFALPSGYTTLSTLRFAPIGGSGTGEVSIRPYDTVNNTFSAAVYTQTFNSTTASISLQPGVVLDATKTYAVYWQANTGVTYNLQIVWTPSTYGYANGFMGYVQTSNGTAYPDTSGDFELYMLFATAGPSVANTTSALQANAISLRSAMDRRLTGLSMMANYDCASFDKHGYCLSFQARYSNFDTTNDGGGIFTAAYKLSDTWRVGSFLDYRVSEKSSSNLKFSNDLPSFGLFAAYSAQANGTGLQAKLLGAVQHGSATITRSELTSTEPGAGKGNMDARLISGEIGFGYGLAQSLVVTPYAGLRFSDVTRGSYTEDTSSSVSYPIAYLDFAQRLTTATLGARVAGQLTDKIGYQLGMGVEHDLRQQTSSYSGTSSITGLTSFDLAVDGVNNRTRAFGSAGLFYQIDKTQRLVTNVSLRNQAYTAQNAASITGGYQIAF